MKKILTIMVIALSAILIYSCNDNEKEDKIIPPFASTTTDTTSTLVVDSLSVN